MPPPSSEGGIVGGRRLVQDQSIVALSCLVREGLREANGSKTRNGFWRECLSEASFAATWRGKCQFARKPYAEAVFLWFVSLDSKEMNTKRMRFHCFLGASQKVRGEGSVNNSEKAGFASLIRTASGLFRKITPSFPLSPSLLPSHSPVLGGGAAWGAFFGAQRVGEGECQRIGDVW